MTLLSWYDVDELLPYPWATIECPGCEETEHARYGYGAFGPRLDGDPYTWFVCMACGRLTQVEAETLEPVP